MQMRKGSYSFSYPPYYSVQRTSLLTLTQNGIVLDLLFFFVIFKNVFSAKYIMFCFTDQISLCRIYCYKIRCEVGA